jgi:hypothetical protein
MERLRPERGLPSNPLDLDPFGQLRRWGLMEDALAAASVITGDPRSLAPSTLAYGRPMVSCGLRPWVREGRRDGRKLPWDAADT